MTKTATARRVDQDQRSPVRQALAGAQSRMLAAKQAAEANWRGRVRAAELTEAAETTLAAAKKRALGTRERHVEMVADSFVSGVDVPAGATRAATAAVADAQDALDAATAARSRLLRRQEELDTDVVRARNELIAAADAVIIAERAAQALEQAEAALAQLLRARRILQAVCAQPKLEGFWREVGRTGDMRREAFAEANLGLDGADVWRHLERSAAADDWGRHADTEPWRAARAALFTDPDVMLPGE